MPRSLKRAPKILDETAELARTVTVAPFIGRVVVFAAGRVIASSKRAKAVIEGDGAPIIFVPEKDVQNEFLLESANIDAIACAGIHFDVAIGSEVFPRAAYKFREPAFGELADHVAFDETLVELRLLPVYLTEAAASELGISQ